MFKVISVYMHKGGVGKTTLTANLAFEMTKYGKVLVIDADQQGNLTFLFNEDFDEDKSLLQVLLEKKSLEEAIYLVREKTEYNNGLYLLGTKKNDDKLKSYIDGTFRDEPYSVKMVLAAAKEAGFNYVFVDLPPTFGLYEKMFIAQANEIIPIVEPEDFAIENLSKFNSSLKKMRISLEGKYNDPKYLVLNKENKNKKVHQYWIETMKTSPYEVYELIDSKAVSSAISMKQTVQEYDAKNKICQTISLLAEKIK